MNSLLDPAPRDSVAHWLGLLNPHLSALSRNRLAKLKALIVDDGRIPYDAAYRALFPDSLADQMAKTRADKQFKKFRDTLSAIAEEHGIHFELKVDQRRKAAPSDRRLWFVTPDDSEERIAHFSERAIDSLGTRLDEPLEQYAAVQSERPEPLVPVIYAEMDRDKAREFLKGLGVYLKSANFDARLQDIRDVTAGEHTLMTRKDWLEQARLILFLVSPGLIAELKSEPMGIPEGPRLLPLGLIPVPAEHLEGTPLSHLELFTDGDTKTWSERSGPQRERWLSSAATAIRDAMRSRSGRHADCEQTFETLCRWRTEVDTVHFVDPLATTGTESEGAPALPLLLKWLRDPKQDVFCAIFGELGMGKTTLCQQLTASLLDLRRKGERLPLPLYLDLRAVNSMRWNWDDGLPPLDDMLAQLIASNYNLPAGQEPPDVAQIKRLAQERGGLVIFDGLDEVMNRLTPPQCRQFIQTLWSILPPAVWKRPRNAGPDWRRAPGVGRLVMSCRSHFFQTLKDQLSFFDGEQRASVNAGDYLWLTLLPFGADQVEAYFRQVFAKNPERADQAIGLIDQVHDLRQLGSRPYNLRLIQEQVDELEAKQRTGESVDIADLYEGMIGQWLRRDDPKHRLKREHKLVLMERLAHRLWSGGQSDMSFDDLETWLVDQLLADPRWERVEYRAYLNRDDGPAVLQEDLRNASFVVREGEDRFRFAHTSIMEFFLARALHRALTTGAREPAALEDWAVPTPSSETLDFLGGLISRRNTDPCLAGLAAIRARYRPRASELALAYALRAAAQGFAGDTCSGFQLQGARLVFQHWQGRPGRHLDWRGSDFSGTELRGGHFGDCDFTDCIFDKSDLTAALFDRCRLDHISAAQPNLTGTVVHDCSTDAATLSRTRLYHTQWLDRLPLGLSDSTGGAPPDLFIATGKAAIRGASPTAVAGHSTMITVTLASPDSGWLASGGADGRVLLWDPASGRELHRLEGHGGLVRALVVAPNGAWLASGGDDGRVRLWDPASGRELHRLAGHGDSVTALAVAPDGAWLASSGADGWVGLWDPASGQELHRLEGHGGSVRALAVAPDGAWVASGGADGSVRLWDPASGRELHRLAGHGGLVRALAVAPDGTWLASSGADGWVWLWDPVSGRELHRLEGHGGSVRALHRLEGHGGSVRALAVAPDGAWVASGGADGWVRLWDPASGRELHRLAGHGGSVRALAVSPDGAWLASGEDDGRVGLWDPTSGRKLHRLAGHHGWVSALAIAPDGGWLASGAIDGRVRLWDPASGRELHRLAGHHRWVRALAVAPNGAWVASGGADGRVRLWDPASGRELHRLAGHHGWVRALAVAPDGSWLASSGVGGRVLIWDPTSGQELHRLEGYHDLVLALAVSPDGSWLASSGDDGRVGLWDPTSGRELHRLEGHRGWVSALAAAPDGSWLALGGDDGRVGLWDPMSGRELYRLEGHRSLVSALAVAPDRSWLASGGDDGQVLLWDPTSGRELYRLEGHRSLVRALAVAPDGSWLASGGDDGRVLLWDPTSGRELYCLEGQRGWVSALAVAPDGGSLTLAGSDGLIRRWTLPTDGGCPMYDLAIELLPKANWVVWQDPDSPGRRWVHWSPGAWRWLGWHASLPDGKHWINYPMDAFQADSAAPSEPGTSAS
ncbi:NACHT and WD40 repeat domain-containing protein [Rhabdochromatium marinum]|uniref:NACHT and WD40 repeat domain-containing protein n=1 Tax=Rhabdochromatium marinum TaxID=48729 RepID=UPI0019045CAF|nr:PQQ-binding-like beta-propeller repeat protein [Rhabdochromatium marinum]MBK1649326.1 hypothetical protein [Rhabdochromatium marinum]